VGIVSNKTEFLNGLRAAVGEQERRFANTVKGIVTTLHHEITMRTPVWSGMALASYEWTIGAPRDGMPTEPVDIGPTGNTNRMPLGPEPRRADNQAVADASLARLSFSNPYVAFWLNNNAPHIGGLEHGELPEAPFTPRSPQGMFNLSVHFVMEKLEAGSSLT
jgi:hypothetical protein